MPTNQQIIFPFRVIGFFTLYILVNIGRFNRDTIGKQISSRNLEQVRNYNYMIPFPSDSTQDEDSVISQLNRWGIAADIFLACLFACLILGFLSTKAFASFAMGFLHFIGVLLCAHFLEAKAGIGYYISSIVFGILLPFVIELIDLFAIFVLKTDFY